MKAKAIYIFGNMRRLKYSRILLLSGVVSLLFIFLGVYCLDLLKDVGMYEDHPVLRSSTWFIFNCGIFVLASPFLLLLVKCFIDDEETLKDTISSFKTYLIVILTVGIVMVYIYA